MELPTVQDMYDWLIRTEPDTEQLRQVWEGLANRVYFELEQEKKNNLLELANQYQLQIPSKRMREAWNMIFTGLNQPTI